MDQYACAVAACTRPYLARGMCDTHYRAWSRGRLQAPASLPPKRPRNRSHPKTCTECNEAFSAPTSTRQFCSPLCRSRASKRRHPTRYTPPAINMRPSCESCGNQFRRTSRIGPTPKECPRCTACRRAAANLAAGYSRAHYLTNRQRYRAQGRAWKAANREFVREAAVRHGAIRRARLANAVVVEFTTEQLAARLSMFPGCWMCGGEPTQIEHVKPISKRGPHMLANLRPACQPCNGSKNGTWKGVAHAQTLRGRHAVFDQPG